MKRFKQFLVERQKEFDRDFLIQKAVDSTIDSENMVDLLNDTDIDESMLFEGGSNSPFDSGSDELYFGGIDEPVSESTI